MSLAAGSRLGPYEIQSVLGAGGMGVVYRARDTKLGREVAVKVLPEAFADDPDRLARFEREARTLASLNHPNIATIYGVEEGPSTGSGQAGLRALVMELVEGETLAERIAQGAMPVEEALRVARQIADALRAAHEHNIIHRDLKPANVKVREDGTVKVLDFGLAKALGPEGGSALDSPVLLTHSPTLSLAATQAGVILGTAAYMAPAQAKGRPADKRCDLWAFGCVLYEMLTGRRVFEGEDATETLAAVVLRDPDWSALPADVPPAVRLLLRRCLERDRRRRLAEAEAALVLIEEAPALASAPAGHGVGSKEQDPAYVLKDTAAAETQAAVTVVRSELTQAARRRMALATAAGVVMSAALVGAAVWWATRPAPPAVVRTEITTGGPTALSINGNDRDLAITPDGSHIVYRGTNQLLVRALDRLEPEVLTGLTGARGVFVSPDGLWIGFFDGFFDGASTLKKVALTGGPPVTVSRIDNTFPRGATWGSDGTIVYATGLAATGLQRVPAAGGDPAVLTKPDREQGEGDHLWPEFLPDGRAVLFTITAAGAGLDNAQVAVLDLATGTYKVVVRGGHHAHYVPTGHLVYGANGTLRAVAFDLDRLETVGTPVPVLEGVTTTALGGVDVGVAANGTMVYVPGRGLAAAPRSLVWVDRTGREEPMSAPPRAYAYPRISPDGTSVAVYSGDEQQDIWAWNMTRETLTRLTLDPAQDIYPVWTPDGRRVIYASFRAGAASQNLWWQPADGTGTAERLSESSNQHFPTSVSPDGTRLVFQELGAMRRDLMMLTLGATSPSPANGPAQPAPPGVTPLLQTPFEERNGIVSPNGMWLAYESDASGRFEIYVRPSPDVWGGQWQLSTAGGTRPLWSRSGQEVFYLAPDGALMAVRVDPRGGAWSAGTPTRVLEGRYFTGDATGNVGRTYDVSPDGRRFLMIKEAAGDEAPPQNLVVVQNWLEELKRLVPTN